MKWDHFVRWEVKNPKLQNGDHSNELNAKPPNNIPVQHQTIFSSDCLAPEQQKTVEKSVTRWRADKIFLASFPPWIYYCTNRFLNLEKHWCWSFNADIRSRFFPPSPTKYRSS